MLQDPFHHRSYVTPFSFDDDISRQSLNFFFVANPHFPTPLKSLLSYLAFVPHHMHVFIAPFVVILNSLDYKVLNSSIGQILEVTQAIPNPSCTHNTWCCLQIHVTIMSMPKNYEHPCYSAILHLDDTIFLSIRGRPNGINWFFFGPWPFWLDTNTRKTCMCPFLVKILFYKATHIVSC